jgi:hypothetical protein
MNKSLSIAFVVFLSLLFSCNAFAQKDVVIIDVKYFHATDRCASCIQIEDFITKTVNLAFKKELNDSTIKMISLDFMQPENEPLMEKYEFDTQALIISKVVNGKEVKFKNLDLIWDYLSDFSKFEKYVEEEIKELLKN